MRTHYGSDKAYANLTSALLMSWPLMSWQNGLGLALHIALEVLAVGLSKDSLRILSLGSCNRTFVLSSHVHMCTHFR